MQPSFPQKLNAASDLYADPGLKRVVARLATTLERDNLVTQVTRDLQQKLGVDRVLLYYFYRHWKGRVTFEVLSDPQFSIFGSTGPDECFNGDYAAMYLAGRVRAIADIEAEPIAECHRDFLRNMQVRANLVVPVLIPDGLWGLLVAHHCQGVHPWAEADIVAMQQGAETLAMAPSVRGGVDM
ncbi:GAF domain-containing protein [Nodosilinea sp. LEGE 07298]|uniref:GAF domain-containing protein n=1 Tax=Nodosilinea sp. LEGE 07298 TaxID=2777970 RepID=UPI0018810973|nr:GAF domain-containing protein [Nodosilinea sp. LEGE 07298]MBE9108821.1 GAF domain-containing protein [Nodosilinea sp. LEGE 07298]